MKYKNARIQYTGEQIVMVSCGAAMLDGRVATAPFYREVLVPAFAKMDLGAYPGPRIFFNTFKQIYNKEAMVSAVCFRYFSLDELETVVDRALQETAATMPALKLAVDWPALKARLDEELARAVSLLQADCVIKKRKAEIDLEECERALKRLKKE